MANPPLSAAQQANTINSQGGATFKMSTGAANTDPVFLVAHDKTDKQYGNPVSAKDVSEHNDSPDILAKAAAHGADANTGWWVPEDGAPAEGNFTEAVSHPRQARRTGFTEKQEAIFANPGVEVRPGVKAEEVGDPWGTTINNNMRSMPMGIGGAKAMVVGANDVNPAYRMKPGRAGEMEFSNYEVRGRHNEVIGGIHNGEPISLQSVLNTINMGRTNDLRRNGVIHSGTKGFHREQEQPGPRPKVAKRAVVDRAAALSEGTQFADGEPRTTPDTRSRIADRRLALHWATE